MTPAPSLLFGLSAADQRRFLPGHDLEREFAPGARRVDVTGMPATEWQRLLEEIAPEVLVTAWDTPHFPEALARQERLPLRYVCHLAGGVRLLPRRLLERGVLVSNWGDKASHDVAEHALLLTLGALRNLPAWGAYMPRLPADRCFELRTRSLRGKRVGLHGFGAVARQLVRMLLPFDPQIRAYSAGVPQEFFEQHGVQAAASLEELFGQSEVLIECEALTPLTRGSVTAAILNLLPLDAIFVNVGRGPVIDEQALVRRAARGLVRVGLDVFAHEPLPADSEFFQLPNVLLSPHIAGPTSETFSVCGEFGLNNVRQYLRGGKIEGLVTLAAYDRSS